MTNTKEIPEAKTIAVEVVDADVDYWRAQALVPVTGSDPIVHDFTGYDTDQGWTLMHAADGLNDELNATYYQTKLAMTDAVTGYLETQA